MSNHFNNRRNLPSAGLGLNLGLNAGGSGGVGVNVGANAGANVHLIITIFEKKLIINNNINFY